MRILHLSTRLILGGSQENTVLSCEGQVRLGHEVHLAFGPIYGPEGSLLDRVTAFRGPDGAGIRTHVVPDMVREICPWRDARTYGQCRALFREVRPDVVHTHSSKAGVLGRAAAWKERVPAVVHTIHGLPFHPYQGRATNWVYVASERFAAKRCHRIVCVCEAMKRQALAAGVGRAEQYVTVYSGMEVETYLDPGVSREGARRELGIGPDEFVIGTVSRLAELKGHDDLLDALGPMVSGERKSWRLLWVGDGWWRERLTKRVKEMGLERRVLMMGLVEPEAIPRHLAAMDVLVHPSYREGLPRTVPQALLAGVPVVVYDVDGAGEVCLDGETGRLVGAGDRAGLAEAVAWMADHPAERAAMAKRGREMCRERFSAEKMVNDLDRLYREMSATATTSRRRE